MNPIAAIVLLAALAQEPPLPTKPLLIKVSSTAGKSYTLPVKGAKATVVIFVMTDCPVANKIAPEMGRIMTEYGKKKVSFFMAYVDPASNAQINAHAKSRGFAVPLLPDSDQKLVKALGPSITPEAAVLDSKGMLVYRGRINDLFEDHGKQRETARNNDLRRTLDEVLAGKKVGKPLIPPIGCYIPKL